MASDDRPRSFLDLDLLDSGTLRAILEAGKAYKRGQPPGGDAKPLAGKALALLFEKPSHPRFLRGRHEAAGRRRHRAGARQLAARPR
jgi:hypothetical protein